MTCNNIILSQPETGSILSHEIPSDVSARLNFGPDDISGLRIGDEGQLVINFVEGGQLNITNFDDVAANGNLLYLEDGTLIDPTILTSSLKSPQDFNNIETAAGAATNADAIRIGLPGANTTQEVNMQAGQKYICDFDPANAATVEVKDGQMVLTFADGSQVVINNYEQAIAGDLPAQLTVADGTVVETENLIIETTGVESVEEILQVAQAEEFIERAPAEPAAESAANIEPAAGDDAEALAAIEPAAGEVGGVSNSGYGFGSLPSSEPLNSPAAIGPLGPTQLAYQAPEFRQENFIVEAAPFDPSPLLSVGSLTLDETNLTSGGGVISGGGTVVVDFGGDGPGTIAPSGSFAATCNLTNNQLSSGGVPVLVTPIVDGYVGTANGNTIFTFVIDSTTGDYIYNQVEPFDHSDTSNDNEEICLDFGIVATDADGDSTTTHVRVNILDDAPVVTLQPVAVVDETDLSGGNLVVTGQFSADPGEDSPATYTGNANGFYAGGSLDNNGLFSNGNVVTVTYDAATNTYTGATTATTVFTMVLDPATGNYTYTQLEPLDHADDTDPDDELTLNFDVTVTDFDGDSATGQITVRVLDDGPIVSTTTGTVDETNLTGGALVVNGSVLPDFGGDGPAATDSVDATGFFDSSGSQLGGTLTQNGVPVVVSFDAVTNTYTGTANGVNVFTMVINIDGTYQFTQNGPLDHNDPNDPNDIINLDFGYSATDFDGDSADSFVRIQVKDDVPSINGSTGDVDETNFDLGPLTYSDTIVSNLGADLATVQADGNFTGAPTSGGVPVVVTSAPVGYVGTVNGATAFTLVIDSETGQYTYTQLIELDHPDSTDPNDIISLGFGVEVTANDGTTDSAIITIDVADDGPVANDDVNGAEEGQDITGSVVANDDLSEDNPNTVTQVEFGGNTFIIPNGGSVPVPTPLGILTLNSDGTYEFSATDAGDPDGTVTFTYTLVDVDGDSDTAELSIRVTPDGEPIAVTEEKTVDETNLQPGPIVINETLNVDFGLDGPGTINPNGSVTVGGFLANNALTSNDVPVVITPTANGYVGVLQGTTTAVFELIIQDNGDYSFELFGPLDHADDTDPNDLIRLDFGITVMDSDGDAVDGNVRINILDDAPVAFDDVNIYDTTNGGATGNVITGLNGGSGAADILSEDNGSTETSDNDVVEISFNGNVVTIPAGGSNTIEGDFGILEMFDNGEYTYTLKPGAGTGATTRVLDPAPADVAGTQSTVTKNGITVTSVNGGDLTFTDDGIGIFDGSGSNRVFGNDEALDVDFAPASQVVLTMGDLGNNPGSAMDFTVYLSDGTTRSIEVPVANIPQVNSAGSVTFDASTFGPGLMITGVDVFSHSTNSSFGKTSFSLVDVKTTEPGTDSIWDTFGYVLQDGDGDRDTATLMLCGEDLTDYHPININGVGQTDDTNLEFGPDVENGVINVNYQGEGPGTTTGNGDFDSSGNRTGDVLSSNGAPVNVTFDSVANTYTGTAGTTTVFTMVINDNGTYTFTQIEPLDHSLTNDNNEALFLDFGVTATDSDGDTGTGTVRITVLDDGPSTAFSNNVILHESNLENGPLVSNGVMDYDFGQDGAGTVKPSGKAITRYELGGVAQTLMSGGQEVVFTQTANGYVGKVGGETIVTLTVDPQTGAYIYTQTVPFDHPEVDPGDDVIWVKFGMTITDADGDSVHTYINIDIADDNPVAVDDKVFIKADVVTDQYCLNPTKYDVSGIQSSITNDGITVQSNNGKDLAWVTNSDGSGIGIAGEGTDKVYRPAETLEVSFASSVTAAVFTLADMGANNIGNSFAYKVYLADGSSVNKTLTIDSSMVVNGMISFEVEGYAENITRVDLIGGPSFVLNNVKAETVSSAGGDAIGNVLTNDDIGVDVPGSVISIEFGGQSYDVPEGGQRVVQGDNGTLTIHSNGQYSYQASAGTGSQTVRSFSVDNPAGGAAGGDIKNVSTSYNETTKDFTFSMTTASITDGIEFAVNDGPNPKNHPGELAFFYVDDTGAEPVVTVYGYNGVSVSSWKDGGAADGNQPADAIFNSITSPELFSNISVTTDANGNKVFSVSLNVEVLQNYDPIYGPDGIWEGVEVGDKIGIWAHTLSDLHTDYNQDGFLTDWSYGGLGWYDSSNKPTETTIISGSNLGDDLFTYTITDADGDTSTATLSICAQDFDNHVIAKSGHDYFGTSDADLFIFDAIGNAAATINNFDLGEDALDLSGVVEGYDPLTDAINDFVYVTQSGGDTIVSVDADGQGGAASREVAELDGVTGQSLEDLIENGNIIV